MASSILPIGIQQPFIYFPGSSIPVLWSVVAGSTWNTTQTPVSDCIGTLTLYDSQGVAVPGATAIIAVDTMVPGVYSFGIDAGSDGSLFAPIVGKNYSTVIIMTSPSVGGPARWTIPSIVRSRSTP